MRSDWMCGLLDAEECVRGYWRSFADYLHNYELRNEEELV